MRSHKARYLIIPALIILVTATAFFFIDIRMPLVSYTNGFFKDGVRLNNCIESESGLTFRITEEGKVFVNHIPSIVYDVKIINDNNFDIKPCSSQNVGKYQVITTGVYTIKVAKDDHNFYIGNIQKLSSHEPVEGIWRIRRD